MKMSAADEQAVTAVLQNDYGAVFSGFSVTRMGLGVSFLVAPVAASTPAPMMPPNNTLPAMPAAPVAGGVVAPGEIGQPPAGYGQIVFFRPSKFVGMAVGFKVREAGKELGLMKNGSYFVIAATPGRHEYEVHSEAKDILPVEVEAGEVYYVSGSLSMGVMVGRPNLTPSDAAAFEAVRAKLKMSKL